MARTDPTGRQEASDGADAEGGGDAPRGDSIANIVEQVRCHRQLCGTGETVVG